MEPAGAGLVEVLFCNQCYIIVDGLDCNLYHQLHDFIHDTKQIVLGLCRRAIARAGGLARGGAGNQPTFAG
jgi:hypothetical protein